MTAVLNEVLRGCQGKHRPTRRRMSPATDSVPLDKTPVVVEKIQEARGWRVVGVWR
jgi:hypothetical protein